MRIKRSVIEYESHLGGVRRDPRQLAALQIAAQLLQLADRLSEIYVYRIKLLHGGEMRRLAVADQRAFRYQGTPDTSADRGADIGVIQLELCAREISLARGNVSLGLAPIGDRGLVLRLRCGLAVDQLFNALGLQVRLDQHRLRLRERGLGSIAILRCQNVVIDRT